MARRRETRTTRLDPVIRRGLILDAAEIVLRDRAPADVTFEAVADAAGVSRALVYNYFGDRNGLLAAVELRTLERLDGELLATLDPQLRPAEQLRPLAGAYLAFARANGPTWRVLAAGGAVHHPAVEAARRSRTERLAALWGGTDEALIAARTVTGMLETATIDWLGEGVDDAVAVNTVCTILSIGLERAGVGLDGTTTRG